MSITLSGIPEMPIRAQLSGHIESGMSPEEAARKVLAPYEPAPLASHVWPFVLQEARDIEGRVGRRVMRAALGVPSGSGGGGVQAARIRLKETIYRLPDGTRVLWDDLTVDEIDVKIAWMRVQVGSLLDHIGILERARALMLERGAGRLGDVDGWVDLVASGEVVAPSGVTARKRQASGNVGAVAVKAPRRGKVVDAGRDRSQGQPVGAGQGA